MVTPGGMERSIEAEEILVLFEIEQVLSLLRGILDVEGKVLKGYLPGGHHVIDLLNKAKGSLYDAMKHEASIANRSENLKRMIRNDPFASQRFKQREAQFNAAMKRMDFKDRLRVYGIDRLTMAISHLQSGKPFAAVSAVNDVIIFLREIHTEIKNIYAAQRTMDQFIGR